MKKKVLPLWQITFDPLKNGLKNIHQWRKNLFFFHQKSEGIAFTFCRYLYQNMRASIFCMYCPPIVFFPQIWKTKKSSKIEGNTLGILRRSFFPSNTLSIRVANVVADHNSLLTQWRPIKMSKFRANNFLKRTTSNYFWASEVFKNQRFKSHFFSFFSVQKISQIENMS